MKDVWNKHSSMVLFFSYVSCVRPRARACRRKQRREAGDWLWSGCPGCGPAACSVCTRCHEEDHRVKSVTDEERHGLQSSLLIIYGFMGLLCPEMSCQAAHYLQLSLSIIFPSTVLLNPRDGSCSLTDVRLKPSSDILKEGN